MESKLLNITEDYLKQLCDFGAKKCMGIILKRVEIIQDKETLKNVIKEHIFEEFRNLRYQIEAYNQGKEITFFNLKQVEK